ncbi:unannotated protein [freshwater metagenome]|uniref:Unannotated protein n=1 Tax=freshwater metagenome TaxID=449393 RepID=A0A6J7ELX1_9ZZZZ
MALDRPLAERERERPVGIAERQPRTGARLLRAHSAALEQALEALGGGRVEAHRLAAAADRVRKVARVRGQQHQVRVVRRLLKRLEQLRGGLLVEAVGILEHEDAPARLEGAMRDRADHRFGDVADEHLRGA